MSDDASSALAAAAAKIAELETELAGARAEVTAASEQRDAAMAAAQKKDAEIMTANAAVAREREQHASDLARASAALAEANTAKAKAQSDYVAVSAKFDRMLGEPVEPGIVAFRKYRTVKDGMEHPSLGKARRHAAALRLGLSDQEAERIMAHIAADPAGLDALREAAENGALPT